MLILKNRYKISFSLVVLLICSLISSSFVFAETSLDKESADVQKIIENYYSESYKMWMDLKAGDLSKYLDLESIQSYNKAVALEENIQRWKYNIEKNYPKDFRERHDIFFDYISVKITGDTAIVKVNLSGETVGMPAYPFFVSLGENIFLLNKKNNSWLISEHEYNDLYFYERSKSEKISYNINELRNQIDEINKKIIKNDIMSNNDNIGIESFPHTDYSFNSSRAVAYANQFVNNANSYFYEVSSDCTNFVSQAISYGFGSGTSYSSSSSYRMVSGSYSCGWFGGSHGGSGPWEGVGNHWNYMTSSKVNEEGPRVTITSWSSLPTGGVMQLDFNSNGTYTHSVICVDKSTEKFAQHSQNGYRYLTQYGSSSKRFYRANYFRVY